MRIAPIARISVRFMSYVEYNQMDAISEYEREQYDIYFDGCDVIGIGGNAGLGHCAVTGEFGELVHLLGNVKF